MTKLRLLPVGLLVLAPLLRQPVAAQALDPTFTLPSGLYASGGLYTMSAQQADGKRVVAGFFSRANGLAASNLARIDAAGATDVAFGQNVGNAGNIATLRLLPNGQYLLGASNGSVTAGGLSRPALLRLNANGTADATFNAGSGIASAGVYGTFEEGFGVQADGKIVVVGEFDSFNGQPAAGVVRLNTDGSVDTGFRVGTGVAPISATNTSNYVDAVTMQPDGKLLVSGLFATFNGQTANGLVRLNTDGSVDASFTSPLTATSEATGVTLQPDGKLLVTGNLSVGGTSVGIVRLNTNGSVDTGFANALANASTFNLNDPAVVVQPDGKILVVGSFVLPSNTRVARLNADGTLDTSFQVTPGSSSAPTTLGLQADGSVLVGGNIITSAGAELPLARLTSSGAVDPAFAPKLQVPGYIAAVVRQPDGQLVVGGNFTELNGQPVQRLARLSAAGVPDAGFSAAAGVQASVVNCLAMQADGKILVGSNGLRRLTTTGSPDASFTYFTGGTVTALAVQPDGRVLVGGAVSSSTYRFLFRITATGAYDPSFVRDINNPTGLGIPNTVGAVLVQPDGRVVVAEDFAVSNTASFYTSRVVRYESTGALDATFNNLSDFGTTTAASPSSHRLYTLGLQADGKLLVGGNFGSVNGTTQAGVARLTTTGTLDGSFASPLPATAIVYSLALQPNGRVLLGGSFTAATTNLARLLPSGQADNTFAATANPSGTVRSLLVQPDGGIVLGGFFTAIGSQTAFGVARITAPNVLAVAAPAAVAARTEAWPVPAHSVLHVAPDLSAHPLSAELLDALGRPVRRQAMGSGPELALPVDNLPPGVYLLRVHYAAGTVSRRLAVE